MPELSPDIEQSATAETEWNNVLKYPWKNLEKKFPGIENKPSFQNLRQWWEQRIAKLPSYKIAPAPLENPAWTAVYSTETPGSLLEVVRHDREFFSLVGVKITISEPGTGKTFEWIQPVSKGTETTLKVNLYGKESAVPVYAMLAVIQDTDENYLITIGQEAMSENEKHAMVRLPIQASSSKLARVIKGDTEADAGLAEMMEVYQCSGIYELMSKAKEVLLVSPEDPDRIKKHNLAMVMPQIEAGSDFHKKLEAGGKRKWVNREQLDMIVFTGLANSHLVASIDLVSRLERLGKM